MVSGLVGVACLLFVRGLRGWSSPVHFYVHEELNRTAEKAFTYFTLHLVVMHLERRQNAARAHVAQILHAHFQEGSAVNQAGINVTYLHSRCHE